MAGKRARCKLDSCRKQFRQTRSDHLFHHANCRKAFERQRKAEEAANGHRPKGERVSYMALASLAAKARKPSTEREMSDEEFMAEWMRVNMPDGPPPRQPAPPPSTDDGPYVVTIKNVPTTFPGTPLSRGRQG